MSSYYSIIIKITILSSFISKVNSYTNKILRSCGYLINTDYASSNDYYRIKPSMWIVVIIYKNI